MGKAKLALILALLLGGAGSVHAGDGPLETIEEGLPLPPFVRHLLHPKANPAPARDGLKPHARQERRTSIVGLLRGDRGDIAVTSSSETASPALATTAAAADPVATPPASDDPALAAPPAADPAPAPAAADPAPAPAPAPPPPPPPTYAVQPGDSLSAIAARLGCSLEALLAANPQIGDPDQIEVGQPLNLPGGVAAPAAAAPEAAAGFEDVVAFARRQPGGPWYTLCLGFVSTCFSATGHEQPELETGYARAAFDNFWGEGRIHVGGTPPRGAIVFWNWSGPVRNGNGVMEYRNWGHVAIANGDGTSVSSPMVPGGPIVRDFTDDNFGGVIGWAMPR